MYKLVDRSAIKGVDGLLNLFRQAELIAIIVALKAFKARLHNFSYRKLREFGNIEKSGDRDIFRRHETSTYFGSRVARSNPGAEETVLKFKERSSQHGN